MNVPDGHQDEKLNFATLQHCLMLNTMTKSLSALAKAYAFMGEQNGSIDDLMQGHTYYFVCDSLFDKARQTQTVYADKLSIGRMAQPVYGQAIALCNLLYAKLKQKLYLEQAFYFSEKGKATVLQGQLSDLNAKQFAGLPKDLVELEKKLKIDQNYYRSKVIAAKKSKSGQGNEDLQHYEPLLFECTRRLDSLKDELETNYPTYFQLKYSNQVASVRTVQNQLAEGQVLLSYFEGNAIWYAFYISKTAFEFIKLGENKVVDTLVSQYLSNFDRVNVQENPDLSYSAFVQSAQGLYNFLLAPLADFLPEDAHRLVIVPDGVLAHMPWGTLLTDRIIEGGHFSYQDLPYLFDQYAVSYHHSATLFARKPPQSRIKTDGNGILAMAPSYSFQSLPKPLTQTKFRDALTPLDWNTFEIETISKYAEGRFMFGSQATESAFKQQSGDYQVLHLAMHALVDNQDAMMSKLVFTAPGDSSEDGLLHTHELFNMELSAKLAVLSACNTGIGDIKKGEGVTSLGMAFAYAGCPSVVMSHWAVPDKSTAQLMGHFYHSLAQGHAKDMALQYARKEFLKNTQPLHAHPAYWAAFVVTGDAQPIPFVEQSNSWLSTSKRAILAVLLFLGAFFLYRLVARKKQ